MNKSVRKERLESVPEWSSRYWIHRVSVLTFSNVQAHRTMPSVSALYKVPSRTNVLRLRYCNQRLSKYALWIYISSHVDN